MSSDQQSFDDPSIEWYGDIERTEERCIFSLAYINVSSTLLSVDKITMNVKGLKAYQLKSTDFYSGYYIDFNTLTSSGCRTKNMKPKNMNDQSNIYHITCYFIPVSSVKKDDVLKVSFNFTVNGKKYTTKTLNLIAN